MTPSFVMDEPDPSLSRDSTKPEGSTAEGREGIDRAFEVIRNHTVHTKGYVLTALQLIEEFGTSDDKLQLKELLESKAIPASAAKNTSLSK